jgi:hypothetical protein
MSNADALLFLEYLFHLSDFLLDLAGELSAWPSSVRLPDRSQRC